MMKKLLAFLLAAVMILVPVTAFAADGDSEDKDLVTNISETFDKVNATLDFSRTDGSKGTVVLSTASYPYNGKIKHPVATVTLDDTTLRKGMDYTVSYEGDCKSVGTHYVVITFVGMYEGEDLKAPFEIYSVDVKGTSIVSLSAAKGRKITVNIKEQKDGTDGYEIQYSMNKDFSDPSNSIKMKNKKSTRTFKARHKNKKYYVRVRTYKIIDGKKYYSDWSKAKTVTTKK